MNILPVTQSHSLSKI